MSRVLKPHFLLWVWIVLAVAAYLVQFRPIMVAILKTLELW